MNIALSVPAKQPHLKHHCTLAPHISELTSLFLAFLLAGHACRYCQAGPVSAAALTAGIHRAATGLGKGEVWKAGPAEQVCTMQLDIQK